MARQEAAKQAASNQIQKEEQLLSRSGLATGSGNKPQRHFMVADYKVPLGTRNRSFELGYN